jgi:PAS domain S-box-containing protein
MTPARIVIVANKGSETSPLLSRLAQLGYEVPGVASEIDSALTLLSQTRVDVVLMMEHPDAEEFSVRILADFHIPTLLVSDSPKDEPPPPSEPLALPLATTSNNELKQAIEIALLKHTSGLAVRRISRLYATLSHVNRAMATTQTRQGLLQETCRVAVEDGGFQMAWVGWRHANEPQVWVAAEHGDTHGYLDQATIFTDDRPEGRGPVGNAIREGNPVVARSFSDNPSLAPWKTAAAESGFTSMAAFPLRVGGVVQGALAVYSKEPDYFQDREVALLEEIAVAVSFALDKQAEETRRIQTERQIKANEEHYRMLYQNAPMAYQSLDANGFILDVNQMWLEMLGYSREEIVGHWFGDYLDGREAGLFREKYPQFKLVGESRGVEYEIRRKDGSPVMVLLSGRVSYTPDGAFQRTHCLLRDITQMRRAEQALNESNRFYQQIIASAKDGIFVCDASLAVCVWNPAMEGIFGIPAADVLGRHAPEVLGFLGQCGVFQEMENIIAGKPSVGLTFLFENGSRSGWISLTNSPLRDASGNIGGVIGLMRDITDQKRAEQNLRKSNDHLRESEERYRRLIEMSPDAVIIQSEGKIVFINPAGLKLLGAAQTGDLVGKPMIDLIHPDSREIAAKRLSQMIGGHAFVPLVEQKLLRLDGKAVDVEVMSVTFSYNSVPAIQIMARDITARKLLEARYLRDQRIETIGALASGIAHDLNNVLAPIVMTIALLRDKCDDPESLAMISAMETSAHRGAGIIQQLLTFGRGASGQKTPIQPRYLIKEIADIARETFPKSIQIVTQFRNSDWLVMGDPTQLHQVLLNLCVNARDAMPKGGKITLSLDLAQVDENDPQFPVSVKSGPHIVISVQDTGKGVPDELREKIFEPFFTTKELGKGTGLGLATCVNLIKRHNGFILLAPSSGTGALFQVYLPANTPVAIPDAKSHAVQLAPANGELVLVVDDEESIRRITRTALERHGYNVVTANDGMDAIAVFKRHQRQIRVVLIDIMMPVMGGLTAMRHLKAIKPDVVILATSGMVPKDLEAELAELKPRAFLPKPFTTWELLDMVGAAIAKPKNN